MLKEGLIHGHCLTISGTTIEKNLDSISEPAMKQTIVRTTTDPLHSSGPLVVLRGNLAPDGAVAKISGLEKIEITGPAKVFDSEEECFEAIMENQITDRPIYMIHGKTDVDEREMIRKVVDTNESSILLASYGTCSTGINIKNINNIIFASPSKSVIRILQSIGRGLRRTQEKNKVKLYEKIRWFK